MIFGIIPISINFESIINQIENEVTEMDDAAYAIYRFVNRDYYDDFEDDFEDLFEDEDEDDFEEE